jgi:hypothetical protein
MNRRRSKVLLPLVLAAFPALLVAAPESVRTPNDKAGCPANPRNVGAGIAAGRRMNIRVITGTTPNVQTDDTGGIPLSACQAGQSVMNSAVSRLCTDAESKGYSCTGFFTGPVELCGPGGGIISCCDSTVDPSVRGVSIVCEKPPLGGFTLGRASGALGSASGDKTDTGDNTPASINAVNTSTNGGNTIASDPLPQHLVNVRTDGTNGIVQWRVFHTQGGPNPRTFNVNTTGLNDQQIHQAIANGFVGTGLGLTAFVHKSSDAALHSWYPQAFLDDDFVRIPNTTGQGVTEIQVTGLEGQTITIEDNTPGGQVPTLSTVGMVLLVALLMLGAWFLHRRQRLQQA